MSLRSLVMPSRRRRAVNLRIKPGLQLQLPLLVLAVTAAFGALFVAHMDQAYGRFVDIGTLEPGLRALVADQGRDFMIVSMAIGGAYVMAVIVTCLVHGHRMLGPIVAFRRHLEGMKNGDYISRLQLRDGDPFSEIAGDLNELSETLRQQEKANRS